MALDSWRTIISAGLSGAISGSLVLTAASASPPAAPANPDCRLSEPTALAVDRTPMPNEHLAFEHWITSPLGQTVNEALWQQLRRSYGETDKTSFTEPLARGLLGTALDHQTKTIVVVVDPARTAVDDLNERLRHTVANVIATTTTPTTATAEAPRVRVQAACFGAADLIDAGTVLSRREWHADARRATFTAYLDPAVSGFRVAFDLRYPAAADALVDKLGARVRVTMDTPARDGRHDDGRPHFGGAGIGRADNNINRCTAAFVVRRNSDGLRGATTAGHCFDNGVRISSGPNPYGATSGKANYPLYDMINVLSALEPFTNVIHTDPCCPNNRRQIGRGNPSVGTTDVCVSGRLTLARCGITVASLDGQLCDQSGCTYALVVGGRADRAIIARPGDSGAPLYSRSGATNAIARGMLIGHQDGDVNGGATLLAERITTIESHLNVTVLTG